MLQCFFTKKNETKTLKSRRGLSEIYYFSLVVCSKQLSIFYCFGNTYDQLSTWLDCL